VARFVCDVTVRLATPTAVGGDATGRVEVLGYRTEFFVCAGREDEARRFVEDAVSDGLILWNRSSVYEVSVCQAQGKFGESKLMKPDSSPADGVLGRLGRVFFEQFD